MSNWKKLSTEKKAWLLANFWAQGWTDLGSRDRAEELFHGITPLKEMTDAELNEELEGCDQNELDSWAWDMFREEMEKNT